MIPKSERRREHRHLVCFPACIEDGDVTWSAVILDLSLIGARLLTRARPNVGSQVRLSLYITPNQDPAIIVGSVVRVESLGYDNIPLESITLWSYCVAVEFDAPATAYEKDIKELAKRQAKRLNFSTP